MFGLTTTVNVVLKGRLPELKVRVGDSVRGAADVIAVLGAPIHTTEKGVDSEEFELAWVG